MRIGGALGLVAAATLIGHFAYRHLDLADVAMIYLLAIAVAAARMGRRIALMTALLCVGSLDFFFIPPRFTFAVNDVRHIGTFGVMLGVGWLVATLTERIRSQAQAAQAREQHAQALNRLASVLAEDGNVQHVKARVESYLERELHCAVRLLLADGEGHLESHADLAEAERAVAQWTFDHGRPSGPGTPSLPGTSWIFEPMGRWGVLGLHHPDMGPNRQSLLPAFAAQIGLTLERIHLEAERTQAHLRAEEEQLRNTLLSCVSHDLRTPLSGITGAATALLEAEGLDRAEERLLLGSIHQEAGRLQRLVNNLLDLTRVESGRLQVQKEWVLLEEVVGSALARLDDVLGARPLELRLADGWVQLDPVLFEQVLVNLVENALKYSAEGSPIRLEGRLEEGQVVLELSDLGPGFPKGEEARVFEKLYRGANSKGTPGAGLGLAICKGIVEAHGGCIEARNLNPGGQIRITLPLEGEPPQEDA